MRRPDYKLCSTFPVFLLILTMAGSQPIWAQEEEDDPADEGQTEENEIDKETCNPPDFSFTWQGYDLVKITATADPEQAFIFQLNYLEPPNEGWDLEKEKACAEVLNGTRRPRNDEDCSFPFNPIRLYSAVAVGPSEECAKFKKSGSGLSDGVKFCLNATENGSTASLYLDRRALLKAGGLIGLKYEALASEMGRVCPFAALRSDFAPCQSRSEPR